MQQHNDKQSPSVRLKLRLQEARLPSRKLEAETPPPPSRVIPYLVITEPACGFGLTVWETLLPVASDADALAQPLEVDALCKAGSKYVESRAKMHLTRLMARRKNP